MNTLILIAGLPGSGKSTVALKLARTFQGKVLDIDEFKRKTVDPAVVTKEIDPPHLRRVYYKLALEAAFILFENGVDTVVMEEVFHLDHLRSEMTEICDTAGVRVIWIEVVCSYDTVKTRLSAGRREKHILSTDQALKMYLEFKVVFESLPSEGRNIHIDNNGSDLDAQLEKVSEHLGNMV